MPLIITIILLLFSMCIYAQNTIADSVFTLDSVIVESSRSSRPANDLPYMVDYLNTNKIQNGNAGLSLNEITAAIPGVQVNNRYNFSLGDKIVIRGIGARSSFGVRGIKIIYDGIPLTFPDGQSQLSNLDLNSAGRIEFLKGPASVLYGNSAGGVINIKSQPASNKAAAVEPQFTAGSYGLQKYSLKASGTISSHSYLVSYSKVNYKGYREHSSASYSVINGIYNNIFSDKILLAAIINYYDAPYLLNSSSLNKVDSENKRSTAREIIKQQGAGEKNSQLQTGISLNYIEENFTWESIIYFINRNVKNPLPGRVINLKRNSGGIRNSINFSLDIFNYNFKLQAGTDLEFQFDNRVEYENNGLTDINIPPEDIFDNINYGSTLLSQDESVLNSGTFLIAETGIGKDFILSAGLRFDYYRFRANDKFLSDMSDDSGTRNMHSLNPSAGIIYKPSGNVSLYANYSTSFLTPALSELSNNPDDTGGLNPNLNPEKIINFESGIRSVFSKITLSAAVYNMFFTGLLIPYQNNSDEVFYRNSGKARNTGAELTMAYKLLKYFDVTASLDYMNFRYTDYIVQQDNYTVQLKGNKIPGISPFSPGITITYSSPVVHAGISAVYKYESYTNDFNGAPPGGAGNRNNYINKAYTEVNIRSGFILRVSSYKLEIFAGVNNLLDEEYNSSIVPNAAGNRFFEPSPKRNWYTGIKALL